MYALYVDESGVEELGAGTSHFVLVGIAIPLVDWRALDQEIERIKARSALVDTEIHTAWMVRKYFEQAAVVGFDQLDHAQRRLLVDKEFARQAGALGVSGNPKRLKDYRRYVRDVAPYRHLTHGERAACLEALATLIGQQQSLRLFADAICKADFAIRHATPYEVAFEQVLSRYQAMLEHFGSQGIVVHDNNTKVATRLTMLARKFHQDGTFYRRIPDIVETPFFVDSALTSMIQMADICAYALRRFVEKGEDLLWSRIESRGDRQGGRCVGVRHYTGPRPCHCPVCTAHGRQP